MKRTEVLMELIREDVRKDIEKEMAEKKRIEIEKETSLFFVFEANTYVNIETFLMATKEYFGLDSDSLKRELYKNGVLYHNGNKYVPNEGFEEVVLLKHGKLYVNRDEIDRYLFVYILQRMSIKNIRDSFEAELENNKTELIEELYRVSNAEFQRNSPVFEDIRLGVNKKSQIDM